MLIATSRLLAVAFASSVSLTASATDYYVSTSLGNDRFDGRQAVVDGNKGPFASIKPLQSVILRHGDRILFHCGERFAGPLNISLNSQDTGELAMGSYGE